jgi:polysaccharide export outer membrane protein
MNHYRMFFSAAHALASVAVISLPLLWLSSCAPGAGLPPLADTPNWSYRLEADDEIRVIVFGEEPLNGQFRVNDRGNISVPLLGPVPAAGLTTADLEGVITQRLKDKKLLLQPSVSIEVLSYRPIFILGEVSKPGQYPYQTGMSVLTAVAVAGGFTYRAESDYASILRRENDQSVEGSVTRGTLVQPGDVINIFKRYF